MIKEIADTRLFFDLCRIATGQSTALSAVPDTRKWRELYEEARRQTLTGVLFAAVERLPGRQRPPRTVLLPWYADTLQLETLNRQSDHIAVAITRRLKELGLRSVLLKGQGVARLYPKPTQRTPGDADIWVEGPRVEVLSRLARVGKVGHITYHHADWWLNADTEAEIHSRPTWMYSPRLNARLQRWFTAESARQFGGKILTIASAGNETVGTVVVPTAAFNLVFLLVHLLRHTFTEGVGLRQLMDYYYTLTLPLSDTQREEALTMIKQLGLASFAGAVMHVEERVFGLPHEAMLTEPRPREGELLLADVMRGGNFGRHSGGHGLTTRLTRVWNLALLCPEEFLFTLPFKVWHSGWRLIAAWRLYTLQ